MNKYFPLLLSILLLAGCASNSQQPPKTKIIEPEESAEEYDYPSKALSEFAYSVQNRLNRQGNERLLQLLDWPAFAEHITKYRPELHLSDQDKGVYLSLLERRLWAPVEENGYFQLIDVNTDRHMLTYLLAGQSHRYLEVSFLHFEGQFRIGDFRYWHSVFPESQRLPTLAELYLSSPRSKKSRSQFTTRQWPEILASQNKDNILQLLKKTEKERHNDPMLQLFFAESLFNAGAKSEFYKIASEFETKESPEWQYFLYLSSHPRQHGKALTHLERWMQENIAVDASLLNAYASTLLKSGQSHEAVKVAYQAIQKDSWYQQSYHTLAKALVQEKQFTLAWDSLKVLNERFDYRYTEKSLGTSRQLAPLLDQPGFKEWLKTLPEDSYFSM